MMNISCSQDISTTPLHNTNFSKYGQLTKTENDAIKLTKHIL